jgi:hypothetical protein
MTAILIGLCCVVTALAVAYVEQRRRHAAELDERALAHRREIATIKRQASRKIELITLRADRMGAELADKLAAARDESWRLLRAQPQPVRHLLTRRLDDAGAGRHSALTGVIARYEAEMQGVSTDA